MSKNTDNILQQNIPYLYNLKQKTFKQFQQKISSSNLQMIQNPELAQSFILLSILRQERDRIVKKLETIPKLQSSIFLLQNQLLDQKQYNQCMRMERKQHLQVLLRQYQKRYEEKVKIRQEAENDLTKLRKNVGQIRKSNKQLQKMKSQQHQLQKQAESLKNKTQNFNQNIQLALQQNKQLTIHKNMYEQQKQIGKKRLKQIFDTHCKLLNTMMTATKSNKIFSGQISMQKQKLVAKQEQYHKLEQQLYQVKLYSYNLQQQIQDKKQNRNRIVKNLQYIVNQQQPVIRQYQSNQLRIQDMEDKLVGKLEESEKLSAEIKAICAEGDLKNRHNRLQEHKIECIKMLTKRLYNCRDLLIIHKRNNSKSNRPIKSCHKLNNQSRLSSFSINLSGYRQQQLTQPCQQIH